MVDLPDVMVDIPDIMVDLPDTMVDLLVTMVQGEPLKSTPPKFSKYKIPSKLAQKFL